MSKRKQKKTPKRPGWAVALVRAMKRDGVSVLGLSRAVGVGKRVVYWWRAGTHVPRRRRIDAIREALPSLPKRWKPERE